MDPLNRILLNSKFFFFSLLKESVSGIDYFILDATNRVVIDQVGKKSDLPSISLNSATKFSWARFCIPELCSYEGIAIYVDSDILILKDISNLEKEIESADFAAVRADEAIVSNLYKKRILQPLLSQTSGNLYLTSVMVFNCCSFKNIKAIDLFQSVSSGEIDYKDVMFLSEKFLTKFNLSVKKLIHSGIA